MNLTGDTEICPESKNNEKKNLKSFYKIYLGILYSPWTLEMLLNKVLKLRNVV